MFTLGRSYRGKLPPLTQEELNLRDRLFRHVDMLGRIVGERNVWTPGSLDASAGYISTVFRAREYRVDEQRYDVNGTAVKNLVAQIDGESRRDEIVVIGAHYDSVRFCPGANDNATGVAAVARTVRFVAFANEEPPFFHTDQMGSMVYARACRARGDRIVAMITPETIGYYSDERGSQEYPIRAARLFYPSTGDFITFDGDLSLSRKLLSTCVRSFRSHTKFPSQAAALPASITGVGWSDHWSFWQYDYPGIMVTDTAPYRYAHYHLPTDTPDKIDFDKTARVVAGLARVVRELAGAP